MKARKHIMAVTVGALLFGCASAQADQSVTLVTDPHEFSFVGSLTTANGIFADSSSSGVSGTFRYDLALLPPAQTSSTGNVYGSGVLAILGAQLDIALRGHTVSSAISKISVQSAGSGVDNEITMVGAFPFVNVDGTSQSGSFSLTLYAPSGSTDPFGLPTGFTSQTNPSNFGGGTVSVGSVGNMSFASFSVTSVTAVPEPSTCLLAAVGLAAVGYVSRRKHNA